MTFSHKQIVNIYVNNEINLWPFTVDKFFVLRNSLFQAFKLTKNADLDKYKYSGYGGRFVVYKSFSFSDGSGFGKIVIILVADMSSSVHIDSKKKYLGSS